MTPGASRLLHRYYALTPLYMAADLLLDVNLRVPSLLRGWGKVSYYAACLLAWWTLRERPSWTAPVGLAESSVNISLLIVGFALPALSFGEIDDPAVLASLESAYTPGAVVAFLVSGAVATVAFRRWEKAALP